MSLGKNAWLRISGLCGIITPIVTFALVSLAIATYPPFSWTENALSDLGIQTGVTAVLFNSGLIIGGILTLMFAFGLYTYLHEKTLGKTGALIFILDALALAAIGVFPENIKPAHYYASVAFFMLFPLATFFITAAFLQMKKTKMGLFTFSVALFAAIVWAIQWTIQFGPNVAIPEALSALSAAVWSIVLGFKMLRHSSHSNR